MRAAAASGLEREPTGRCEMMMQEDARQWPCRNETLGTTLKPGQRMLADAILYLASVSLLWWMGIPLN
jgi:hypothetical protein